MIQGSPQHDKRFTLLQQHSAGFPDGSRITAVREGSIKAKVTLEFKLDGVPVDVTCCSCGIGTSSDQKAAMRAHLAKLFKSKSSEQLEQWSCTRSSSEQKIQHTFDAVSTTTRAPSNTSSLQQHNGGSAAALDISARPKDVEDVRYLLTDIVLQNATVLRFGFACNETWDDVLALCPGLPAEELSEALGVLGWIGVAAGLCKNANNKLREIVPKECVAEKGGTGK